MLFRLSLNPSELTSQTTAARRAMLSLWSKYPLTQVSQCTWGSLDSFCELQQRLSTFSLLLITGRVKERSLPT